MKPENKIRTVMREFKKGELHSGPGGKVVKNPKQAIAIALSEAGKSKPKAMKEGGKMKKESKAMAKKEIAFMQKKGAPKSMIKHEKEEYGMKKGGKAYARGGGIEIKGKTRGKMVKMMGGGKAC